MIPKKIHYCWFGNGKKTKLIKKCILSWTKYCPDFEIIEWNESNFDIYRAPLYVQQAYENKKWAFVTDYVRLWALTMYGGIYVDTDVELIKSLDLYLKHEAFSGFESETHIPTGIMGCEKGFALFKEFLEYYTSVSFINPDGTLNMTTNVSIMTNICLQHGFVPEEKYQVINGFALYPREYFCPFDNNTGVLHNTDKTVAIHWFNKSWIPMPIRIRSKLTRPFHRLFGDQVFDFLKDRQSNE